MKVSIIEQVVLIGVAIIVQIFVGSDLINKQFPSIFFVSNVLLSAIFFYAIYILFDTANSIFVILEFENDKDTKNKTEDRNEKD
jgi:uncharacterized protein YacL